MSATTPGVISEASLTARTAFPQAIAPGGSSTGVAEGAGAPGSGALGTGALVALAGGAGAGSDDGLEQAAIMLPPTSPAAIKLPAIRTDRVKAGSDRGIGSG
jgi:hypothetical protein